MPDVRRKRRQMMSTEQNGIHAGRYYPEVRHLRECARMDETELLKRTRDGAIYGSGRRQIQLLLRLFDDSSKEAMIENAMLRAAIHRVIGIQLAHEDEYTQVCVNILRAALLGDYREPEVAYLDS